MSDEIPVLDAYATDNQWRVWCKYCDHWHSHGASPGYRVAHCMGKGYEHGYILRYAGRWEDRPIHSVGDR